MTHAEFCHRKQKEESTALCSVILNLLFQTANRGERFTEGPPPSVPEGGELSGNILTADARGRGRGQFRTGHVAQIGGR